MLSDIKKNHQLREFVINYWDLTAQGVVSLHPCPPTQLTAQDLVSPTPVLLLPLIDVSAFNQGNVELEPATLQLIE